MLAVDCMRDIAMPMSMRALLPRLRRVHSRGVNEGAGNSGGCGGEAKLWRGWATMGLRVLLVLTLLLLADAQKWPLSGHCQPCQCYYKMTSFGRLRTVNCSQRGLSVIPANLPVDLMALDLSRNSLDMQQLRQQLCKFKSLKSLSLSFADLTTLSDILKDCTSVLELNLTGNRLDEVNLHTFQGLKNLRRLLGLEVESIASGDVFKELTSLKDLDLIFHGDGLPGGLFDNLVVQSLNLVLTQASALPPGIFSFGQKTLNTLQLIGERVTELQEDLLGGMCVLRKLFLVLPSVQRLPERLFHSQQQEGRALSRPSNLQEVEISGVHTLPPTLFNQLASLESLQLKEIGSFPEQGFMAQVINLRMLVITGSKLTSVPARWFQELYSLQTLKLSSLQLENLHEDALQGLISLTYLDLSYNKLQQISGKLLAPVSKTLETLILSGNSLTRISYSCLKGLQSLRSLDVSENLLSNVYAKSFTGMTFLSVLYLNNNRLTSLPKDLFVDLPQLEFLSVSDNYLVEFPKAVLPLNKSLINLDLGFNALRQVPAYQLCQFKYLETVNIMDNNLHCNCPLLAFRLCPETAVEGQCKTPAQYQGQFLKDIELPKSCQVKLSTSQKPSDRPQSPDPPSQPSSVTISGGASSSVGETVVRELFPDNVTSTQSTGAGGLPAKPDTVLPSNGTRTTTTESTADSGSAKHVVTYSPPANSSRQPAGNKISISSQDVANGDTLQADSLLQAKNSTSPRKQSGSLVTSKGRGRKTDGDNSTDVNTGSSEVVQPQPKDPDSQNGTIEQGVDANAVQPSKKQVSQYPYELGQDKKISTPTSPNRKSNMSKTVATDTSKNREKPTATEKAQKDQKLSDSRQSGKDPNTALSTLQSGAQEEETNSTKTSYAAQPNLEDRPEDARQSSTQGKAALAKEGRGEERSSEISNGVTVTQTIGHPAPDDLVVAAGRVVPDDLKEKSTTGSAGEWSSPANGKNDVMMGDAPDPDTMVTPGQPAGNGSIPNKLSVSHSKGQRTLDGGKEGRAENNFLEPSSKLNGTPSVPPIVQETNSATPSVSSDSASKKAEVTAVLQEILQMKKLPADLKNGEDDDLPVKSSTDLDPQGQELGKGKGDDKSESQDTMAFNFTISALAALAVFGSTVLGVFCLRRWQQKGAYVLSNADTEMHSLQVEDSPEASTGMHRQGQ